MIIMLLSLLAKVFMPIIIILFIALVALIIFAIIGQKFSKGILANAATNVLKGLKVAINWIVKMYLGIQNFLIRQGLGETLAKVLAILLVIIII